MNATTRRITEMGRRAVKFIDDHPDSDGENTVAEQQVRNLVAQALEIAGIQRNGLIDVHAAAKRKLELRRLIRSRPIAHLATVGKKAARENHELGNSFSFKPGGKTYLAFRTAAGTMLEAAQTHKDVLLKYGLSVSVLEEFVRLLAEFDAAVTLGERGRTAHTGATRKLTTVATEIVQTVKVMDARNRQRFQDDEQLLGSWINASRVLGTPRGTPVSTSGDTDSPNQDTPAGDVRPAA
jgi:hypothetical protein